MQNNSLHRLKKARRGDNMILKKITELAEEHNWTQQTCGMTGISGTIGTNFSKMEKF